MKKLILFIVILLLGVGIVYFILSKQSNSDDLVEPQKVGSISKEDAESFNESSIVPNKDYTNNISGKWSWTAFTDKTYKNKLAIGAFFFKQKEQDLTGFSLAFTPIQANKDLGGNKDAKYAAVPGHITHSAVQDDIVQFIVTGKKGTKVQNIASIEQKGRVLKGKSEEFRGDSEEPSKTYYWVAKRISDN